MAEADPFGFIAELCSLSDSQEDRLHHSRLVGEPNEPADDSGEIPVAYAGLTMVSPPESSEVGRNEEKMVCRDIFETPPEEFLFACSDEQQQQPQRAGAVDHHKNCTVDEEETVAVDGSYTEVLKAVDLGKDVDQGFAEVELEQRTDINGHVLVDDSLRSTNQFNQSKESAHELKKVTALKRGSSPKENLGGSSSNILKIDQISGLETPKVCLNAETEKSIGKRLKSLDKLKFSAQKLKNLDKSLVLESRRDSLGIEAVERRENLTKSNENFKSEKASPYDHGSKTPLIHQSIAHCGENLAKRKLEFCTELLDSDMEGGMKNGENSGAIRLGNNVNGASKRIDDIDKFKFIGPDVPVLCKNDKDAKLLRVLSLYGPVEDAGKGKNREVTPLDVLKVLGSDCDYDPGLVKLSVFEVAKRRGMTFP